MRLERGALLRTHHQMGLRRTKSPPLHAGVRPQSPHPFPTLPPGKVTGPALSPRQTKLWSQKAIRTRGGQITSPQQGRGGKYPRGVWRVPVPSKGSRWGITPCTQLSRIPTSKPNRANNGAMQKNLRLHVMPERSRTHLPSKRHGPRNQQ